MHDVIVFEEEYESVSQEIRKVSKKIDRLIDSYIHVMKQASENAVVSGETAEALRAYVSYAEGLKGVIYLISENQAGSTQRYLDAVDTADSYLY